MDTGILRTIPHFETGATFPQLFTFLSRAKTFEKWPADHPLKPHDLACAGFFHQKIGNVVENQVRCYHCGGIVRSFELNADAWTEHAFRFPTCSFLIWQKGKAFVDKVHVELKLGTAISRLNTFINWSDHKFKAIDLAYAGFYHVTEDITQEQDMATNGGSSDTSDLVRCFQCKEEVLVGDCDPEEDIWEWHATSSKPCPYYLMYVDSGSKIFNEPDYYYQQNSRRNSELLPRPRVSQVTMSSHALIDAEINQLKEEIKSLKERLLFLEAENRELIGQNTRMKFGHFENK